MKSSATNTSGTSDILTVLGLFILLGCLIGVIPGFETATAIALGATGMRAGHLVLLPFSGNSQERFRLYQNFLGPVWWLVPLLFIIEIFSHLARILSLTIRLFANMFASDMVILVFLMVPIPIPFYYVAHSGVAIVQTYIFVLLATVYIGEAVAHEH